MGVATDFWVGVRIVGRVALTPKYPKNRKKHRILATSFSNLGGDLPGFQECGGQYPPSTPPRRRRPWQQQTIKANWYLLSFNTTDHITAPTMDKLQTTFTSNQH